MNKIDVKFVFKKCGMADLEEICQMQETVFDNLDNRELLRRNSVDMLAECLSEPHYTMGAFDNDRLAGFAVLYDGGNTSENIGLNIGLSGNELQKAVNLKLVMVLPDYRGHGLQKRLILMLEEIAKARGKKFICATVSPKNTYSCKNFEEIGYIFHSKQVKYGGLERNIYYKKLV